MKWKRAHGCYYTSGSMLILRSRRLTTAEAALSRARCDQGGRRAARSRFFSSIVTRLPWGLQRGNVPISCQRSGTFACVGKYEQISGAERHKKVWVSSCPEESVHCRSILPIPIKQCRVMIGYLLQPLCTSCCCLPATVTHLLSPAKRMQQCTRESVR